MGEPASPKHRWVQKKIIVPEKHFTVMGFDTVEAGESSRTRCLLEGVAPPSPNDLPGNFQGIGRRSNNLCPSPPPLRRLRLYRRQAPVPNKLRARDCTSSPSQTQREGPGYLARRCPRPQAALYSSPQTSAKLLSASQPRPLALRPPSPATDWRPRLHAGNPLAPGRTPGSLLTDKRKDAAE